VGDKELKKNKLKSPRSVPLKFTKEIQITASGNTEHLMAPASPGLHRFPSPAWEPSVHSREMLFIF